MNASLASSFQFRLNPPKTAIALLMNGLMVVMVVGLWFQPAWAEDYTPTVDGGPTTSDSGGTR
ncbi:hypothetical protein [Geitlerinema sp. PCC 7407]|uniref:hypothetical protein n=1 Tax=Geitlerinema sp. PCC 7407 TaxID=1173025 RepID=UPI00029FB140|nr:hypothetical protein [Geitlerinema sp. PCC 7407]AFY68242.1 integral membrane transport protein [Geitlerinema sp. PCC 7407]